MKYLKLYEFFSVEQSDDQKAKNKASHDSYDYYKKVIQNHVDKMNPKCVDVSQDIKDIFLEWTDDGIELNDIQLCVQKPGGYGFPFAVYYPLGWQTYKRGNPDNGLTDPSYFTTYGGDVHEKITKIMENQDKLYYNITFGTDVSEKAKKIQGVRWSREVNYDADDIKHLFDMVGECADDLFKRLNSMYNIKVIESVCYLVEEPIGEPDDKGVIENKSWVKCKPIPEKRTSKISWVFEINK
jgi:hypothetical protein